jgi:shikimate kinase
MTDATVLPRPVQKAGSVSAIALVGFMGAGKTTVGQALAEQLGWRFADLDQLIEAREGRTVLQIFEQDGEPGFRELERIAVAQVLASNSGSLVLAVGGGAFVSERIREILRANQVPAIWLDAPSDELFRRCEQPGVVRPLRRDRLQFQELYEQRLSSYRQADLHVITTDKEVSRLVEEIITRLRLPQASGSVE